MIRHAFIPVAFLALTASLAAAQEDILPDRARIRAELPTGDDTVPAPDPLPAAAEVPVFRGDGPPAPESPPAHVEDEPQPGLSRIRKAALLAGVRLETSGPGDGGLQIDKTSGPWQVSPVRPVHPDRLWLGFANARLFEVHPDVQAAIWLYSIEPGEQSSMATLRLAPIPQADRYLVECLVQPEDGSYRVRAYPGGSEHTFTETGSLLFVYEDLSDAQARFDITGHGRVAPWRLYSCEVLPLR